MDNFAKNGIQEAILSQKRKILDERSPKKTNKEKTPLFCLLDHPGGVGGGDPADQQKLEFQIRPGAKWDQLQRSEYSIFGLPYYT